MMRLFDREFVAGISSAFAHLFCELEHRLYADGKIRTVEQTGLLPFCDPRISGSLSYQPVVPTTILAPVARQARMFWTQHQAR